mmetsp:Transcript_4023/g.7575  ORF Transcript_4023/g.7575 Transcript_4023/m.7575 type:complete len:213 (+) Transcript_4023:51-689(+)
MLGQAHEGQGSGQQATESRSVKPPGRMADETLEAVAAASAEERAWELLLAIAGAHAEGGGRAATKLGCLAEEASQLLEVAPAPKASIAKAASTMAVAAATRSAHPQQNSGKATHDAAPQKRQVATAVAAPLRVAAPAPTEFTSTPITTAAAAAAMDLDAALEAVSCHDEDSDFEAVVAVAEEARIRYGNLAKNDRSTFAAVVAEAKKEARWN